MARTHAKVHLPCLRGRIPSSSHTECIIPATTQTKVKKHTYGSTNACTNNTCACPQSRIHTVASCRSQKKYRIRTMASCRSQIHVTRFHGNKKLLLPSSGWRKWRRCHRNALQLVASRSPLYITPAACRVVRCTRSWIACQGCLCRLGREHHWNPWRRRAANHS
jgi:hypothetical protein